MTNSTNNSNPTDECPFSSPAYTHLPPKTGNVPVLSVKKDDQPHPPRQDRPRTNTPPMPPMTMRPIVTDIAKRNGLTVEDKRIDHEGTSSTCKQESSFVTQEHQSEWDEEDPIPNNSLETNDRRDGINWLLMEIGWPVCAAGYLYGCCSLCLHASSGEECLCALFWPFGCLFGWCDLGNSVESCIKNISEGNGAQIDHEVCGWCKWNYGGCVCCKIRPPWLCSPELMDEHYCCKHCSHENSNYRIVQFCYNSAFCFYDCCSRCSGICSNKYRGYVLAEGDLKCANICSWINFVICWSGFITGLIGCGGGSNQ